MTIRAYETRLINLALRALYAATLQSTNRAVGTIDVRLALRIAYYFSRDRGACDEFWRMATKDPRHPWENTRAGYALIVHALLRQGWEIDEVNFGLFVERKPISAESLPRQR